MRPKRIALLAVMLGALGMLGGSLVRRCGTGPAAPEESTDTAPVGVAVLTAAPSLRREALSEPSDPLPRSSDVTLGNRRGVIRGRCLSSADHAPLDAVSVVLRAWSGSALFPAGRRESQTDREGNFEVAWDGSEQPMFAIVLSSRRYSPRTIALSSSAVAAGLDLGDVLLSEGIRVVGSVVDVSGRPASGAHVEVRLYGRLGTLSTDAGDPMAVVTAAAVADERGEFDLGSLPAGMIQARARGSIGPLHDCGYWHVTPDVDTVRLRLRLEEVKSFRVRLVCEGAPVLAPAEWRLLDAHAGEAGGKFAEGPDASGGWTLLLSPGEGRRTLVVPEGFQSTMLQIAADSPEDLGVLEVVRGSDGIRVVAVDSPGGVDLLSGIVAGSRSARFPALRPAVHESEDVILVAPPIGPISVRDAVFLLTGDARYYWRSGAIGRAPSVDAPPIRLDRNETSLLAVVVTDDDTGAPISGAKVGVLRDDPTASPTLTSWGRQISTPSGPAGTEQAIVSVLSNSRGTASVPLIPGFTFRLRVSKEGYSDGFLSLGPDSASAVAVRLARGSVVELMVPSNWGGYWGEPSLLLVDGRRFLSPSSVVDGDYKFLGVPDGTVFAGPAVILKWLATTPWIDGFDSVVGVTRLDVSGHRDYTVSLRNPGDPAWILGQADADAVIVERLAEVLPRCDDPGDVPQHPVGITSDGRFQLGPLPAGRYLLRVFSRSRVVASTDLEIEPGSVLHVRIAPQGK